MVKCLPSRHEVCAIPPVPLVGARRGRGYRLQAGQASGEPREVMQDAGDVTTVRILPSLQAVDAHDGGSLSSEYLLNLRHFLQLWGYIFRVHVVVGGEGFGVLLVAVEGFAPVCLQKSKVQKLKSGPHHVVLVPWRSGSVCTF